MIKYALHQSVIQRNPNQLYTSIDGEIIFLNMNSGEYVALNQTASIIWQSIENPEKVSTLINMLLNEFEVEREICEKQTLECLNRLLKKGYIELGDKSVQENL